MAGFGLTLHVEDKSEEALKALGKALERGLTACGMQAERTAKQRCPVGNPKHWNPPKPKGSYIGGTLRNSITYALDGEGPHVQTYKVKNGDKQVSGSYDGQTPKEGNGLRAVYVGTNVYYAPYVEMGTSKYPKERPFIKPAIVDNRDEFKRILQEALEGTGSWIE